MIENSSTAVFEVWRSVNYEEEIILQVLKLETDDNELTPKIQSLTDIYAHYSVVAIDPIPFGDACRNNVWMDAMKEEITAIERNKT